jgi:hypothetical protein
MNNGRCRECQLADDAMSEDSQNGIDKQDGIDFWSTMSDAGASWDCTMALSHYVGYRCDQTDNPDVDEITVDFLSLPEEFQRKWQNGPPPEVAGQHTPIFKKAVSLDYYEAVQTLLCLAEDPSSKFVDLVVFQVNALLEMDAENPHLRCLLKAICWTGTQPGAPFDRHSEKILRDWLKELTFSEGDGKHAPVSKQIASPEVHGKHVPVSKQIASPEVHGKHVPVSKQIVSRDYYEVVQTLLCLAEVPSSKFVDLVVFHVKSLLENDPKNPHLHRLLKAICWTGTQPGAPFDRHSEKILRDWLKELSPAK